MQADAAHFIADGIASALEQGQAGPPTQEDVALAGGAAAIQQYLAAGLVDELLLHVVPVLLGDGERLFMGLGLAGLSRSRSRRLTPRRRPPQVPDRRLVDPPTHVVNA